MSDAGLPGRPRRVAGCAPDRLFDLANGYFAPKALLAANALGLFDALAAGPLDAAALAGKIGADARATRLLCDALAGIDLLERRDAGRYANGPEADRFLVHGREGSICAYLELADRTYGLWDRLGEAVRSGRPVRAPDMYQNDPAALRSFILGMHATASTNAPLVAAGAPVDGEAGLLDLGGGPGTYAIAYCRRNPRLRATLFDLPATVAIAREVVAAAGLSDRIAFRAGDFHEGDLGGPYDAAFVSHIVHGHSEERVRALFRRVAEALRPGGRVICHDFFLAEDRTAPAFGALFSLNMLVQTDGGRSVSFAETAAWLADAGFGPAEWLDLGEARGITVVVAARL